MADYKELLRRAISALPENNGAARRAVYEKARSALVGQLRAITPPLPARDITQHRLQLEDCIRQVEQEASEAVISLGRDSALAFKPAPRTEAVIAPAPTPAEAEPPEAMEIAPAPVTPPASVETPKPRLFEAPKPVASVTSIEDIIEEAAAVGGSSVTIEPDKKDAEPEPKAPVETPKPDVRPIPSIVARAEATKSGPSSPLPGASNVRPIEAPLKAPNFEPRRDALPFAANSTAEPLRSGGRGETALARQQVIVPLEVVKPVVEDTEAVETALSSVREVEVEPAVNDPSEAESAMATAIEVLDREARGETAPALPELEKSAAERGSFAVPPAEAVETADDASFAAPRLEPRSGAGLTIFLVVFAILLAGVGGAGFWAWREGYVDLDQMFGQAQPATEVAETAPQALTPSLAPPSSGDAPADNATGPGNTATTAAAEPTGALEIEDRLEPTPEAVVPEAGQTALPGIDAEVKTEERLAGEDTAIAAADPAASVDPSILAGSQSLLLEASQDGRTGAVPFSGTIAWSEGTDELGLPTLIGKASIPARNLGVELIIRKNADPSLPASHLMEVNFQVSDSFIGGTIAGLPGVLLKNEELVPGTPLVGASARVVGNSFLFALSAAANDTTTNTDLLENRKWIDLAVVYGTGRNAIITLEKDDTAQALFQKVFTTWNS
ncbi:hypothetical protein GCM10007913_01440 [Devosia yakushimensis]|uniref:CheA signal transduction histidine kinase n=1 Tax=Devosia yakushimensis TaxID=470028 RepID=A0ABQ5U7Y5_9HYPH|nr:hypothetical protein [Devosia yakushimensis]GLQ08212.1 hypothetical protein GCM10007913_01440 [Devosia yakushimensis]